MQVENEDQIYENIFKNILVKKLEVNSLQESNIKEDIKIENNILNTIASKLELKQQVKEVTEDISIGDEIFNNIFNSLSKAKTKEVEIVQETKEIEEVKETEIIQEHKEVTEVKETEVDDILSNIGNLVVNKIVSSNRTVNVNKEELKEKVTDYIGNMIFDKILANRNKEVKEPKEIENTQEVIETIKVIEVKETKEIIEANYSLPSEVTLSFGWRGAHSKHPSKPNEFDMYRNTTTNAVYIYDGKKWNLLVKDGESTTSVYGSGTGKEEVIRLIQQYSTGGSSFSGTLEANSVIVDTTSFSTISVQTSASAQELFSEIDTIIANKIIFGNYTTNDVIEESNGDLYVCMLSEDSKWCIKKIVDNISNIVIRYANVSNNQTVVTYEDAKLQYLTINYDLIKNIVV